MSRMLEVICTALDLDEPRAFFAKEKVEYVVRCRDCEHYDPRDAGCMCWVMAANKLLHVNNPDGFCAWGERRGA